MNLRGELNKSNGMLGAGIALAVFGAQGGQQNLVYIGGAIAVIGAVSRAIVSIRSGENEPEISEEKVTKDG